MAVNVFGEALLPCSYAPVTGFYRDGCCKTGFGDVGEHTICAVMTEDFLDFTKSRGNDLSTPRPEHGFSGLKPGDRWCLCATRWMEAYEEGRAPLVILEATEEAALNYIELSELTKYAYVEERSS